MTPPRVDALTVQAKLRLLRELVEDFEALGDVDESRLQRVCSHIAASRLPLAASWGYLPPAGDYRGAFADAVAAGLLDEPLASSLGAGAGMRNLLVHEYVRVDLALVAAAVPRARADAEAFVRQVSAWLLRQG